MPDRFNSETRAVSTPTFYPREPISADDLNRFGRAIKAPMRGVNPPRQSASIPPFVGAPPAQMRVVSESDDFISCNLFDGTNPGVDLIKVAKPPLMRVGKLNGTSRTILVNGVSTSVLMTKLTANSMTAKNQSDNTTETWVITMAYNANDVIYAAGNVSGGVGVTDCDFIDLNADGRGWAKQ